MELHEYAMYDTIGLRDLIAAGEVTPAEVEAVARQALDVANAENGLALPVFSPALDHAGDGPFSGVPFLIKDSGPMAEGVPFFLGSRSLQGVVAQHDSDLMTRFRTAGLVTLGLTTVPEMALSFSTESVKHGPTRNPWDLERGVGGSSGGAAALVGLKPSRGRTPCGPDLGEAQFGMAYEFGLTRTVRDAAHLLDALEGPGVGDKYTAPPPPGRYADELGRGPGQLQVAVTTHAWSGVDVDPEVAAATVQVGRMLKQMGHVVTDQSPVVDWGNVIQTMVTTGIAFFAAPLLMAPRQPDPNKMEAVTRQLLEEARVLSALDLVTAFNAQNRVTRSVGAFFAEHDLLVTPTLGQLPAPHGALQYDIPDHTVTTWIESVFGYGPFTAVFNISGQPAISLPAGTQRQRTTDRCPARRPVRPRRPSVPGRRSAREGHALERPHSPNVRGEALTATPPARDGSRRRLRPSAP